MSMMRWMAAIVVVALALVLTAPWTLAQDDQPAREPAPAREGQGGGPGGGERGGRGGGGGGAGGGGDIRAAMESRFKERLGADDDEWKVLQPRLEKVMTLQFQSRFGGMGRGFGRGPGGGGGGGQGGAGAAAPGPGAGGDRPQSEVSKASDELQKALDDKTSSNEVIKAKLTALRAARTKAREDLAKAQKELRDVLSVRQEAQLVSMGTLD